MKSTQYNFFRRLPHCLNSSVVTLLSKVIWTVQWSPTLSTRVFLHSCISNNIVKNKAQLHNSTHLYQLLTYLHYINAVKKYWVVVLNKCCWMYVSYPTKRVICKRVAGLMLLDDWQHCCWASKQPDNVKPSNSLITIHLLLFSSKDLSPWEQS